MLAGDAQEMMEAATATTKRSDFNRPIGANPGTTVRLCTAVNRLASVMMAGEERRKKKIEKNTRDD